MSILPQVNHHLRLGDGKIDWPIVGRTLIENSFQGPAILEVGGIPKSGGFGRDTDETLIQSFEILKRALQ